MNRCIYVLASAECACSTVRTCLLSQLHNTVEVSGKVVLELNPVRTVVAAQICELDTLFVIQGRALQLVFREDSTKDHSSQRMFGLALRKQIHLCTLIAC